MHAQQMFNTHPGVRGSGNDALIHCAEECYDCAQTCIACADACLGESQIAMLVACIRLDLDCAEICKATGAVATRRTGSNAMVLNAALAACAEACRACAQECRRHADYYDHCRICAEVCEHCVSACKEAAQALMNKASVQ